MTMAAVGQNLTQAEREQAVRYLAETRANLADSVKGLSDAQYNFKPAPGRWPVAEIVEHLALVEGVITPTGRWTPQAALEHFLGARAQTVALLQSIPDLRQHIVEHPALGPSTATSGC